MNPGPTPRVAVFPILGPDGAGKTTLHAALAQAVAWKDGLGALPVRAVPVSGATVNVLDARTAWGYLQIVDFPGASHEPTLLGTAPPTGALLVVSATDSIQPGTWDSLQNARHSHVARIVVALTKCDQCEDPEMLDLVMMEVRETLNKHRFDGDGCAILPVSAVQNEPHRRHGSPIVPVSDVLEALARVAG
jgi:elongation factor Tu